ncbi:MAG: DUF2207 domain-containing protein [Acidobacteriota bacterium]|nr:DUF2207 domain-containing protein [Acidobacteriota bacterium]
MVKARPVLSQLAAGILLSVVFIFLSLPLAAQEEDFYLPLIKADIYVQKDGSFLLDEYLTFEFQGDFSWASLWHPLEVRKGKHQSSKVDIANFQVRDENGQPLPLETTINGERLEARWHFRARNERRTFHVSYLVKGAILDYADISELYWQVIGDQVDRPTARAEVFVHLPEEVKSLEDFLVYGHGPLSGKSEIIDRRTVKFQAVNIPAHQFFEIRVIWPARLVAGVPASGYTREKIIEEEQELVRATMKKAEEAREAEQKMKQTLKQLGLAWASWQIVGPLIWLLFYFYFWKKVGEDYHFDDIPEYYREMPSSLPPALVQVLRKQGGKVEPVALTATIFDLARRGYLEIVTEQVERKGLFGSKFIDQVIFILKKFSKNQAGLKDFEQQVLDLMSEAAVENGLKEESRLSLDDFTAYLKKSPTKFQTWFQNWSKEVARQAKELGFIEPASHKAYKLFLFISLPLAVITFSPVLIVMVIALSPTLKRRRKDWAKENKLWIALERFLKDFSDFKEIPAEAYKLWDQYLVFGILFGQAKKLVKMIPEILSDEKAVNTAWLGGLASVSAANQKISSISDMIASIERAATAISQASTSAAHYSSGGGGGFSSGGGGGGGGGGISAG